MEIPTPKQVKEPELSEVFWRCTLHGCVSANPTVYKDDPRKSQKKYLHCRTRSHRLAEAVRDGAEEGSRLLAEAAQYRAEEGEEEVSCHFAEAPRQLAEGGHLPGSTAAGTAAAVSATLSEGAAAAAAVAAAAAEEELRAAAQTLSMALRQQGFGTGTELLGVICSDLALGGGRWLSALLKGVYIRTPQPYAGRACYQKLKSKSAGGVVFSDVYVFWCTQGARWRIGDRHRVTKGGRTYAQSPPDYRRPELSELHGTWLVREGPQSDWAEDPALRIVRLTHADA